jgi:hypothetical protein
VKEPNSVSVGLLRGLHDPASASPSASAYVGMERYDAASQGTFLLAQLITNAQLEAG